MPVAFAASYAGVKIPKGLRQLWPCPPDPEHSNFFVGNQEHGKLLESWVADQQAVSASGHLRGQVLSQRTPRRGLFVVDLRNLRGRV